MTWGRVHLVDFDLDRATLESHSAFQIPPSLRADRAAGRRRTRGWHRGTVPPKREYAYLSESSAPMESHHRITDTVSVPGPEKWPHQVAGSLPETKHSLRD
jgi:hypothetical protein